MGLDSVELLMEMEKTFNHEVPNEEAEKMATINDAVDYFFNHIPISPQEEDIFNYLFERLRKCFIQLNICIDESFAQDTRLSKILPFENRKQIWKELERTSGLKLPSLGEVDLEITSPKDLSMFGLTWRRKTTAITDLTIRRFIDCVFSLNYPKLVKLPKVSSKYEIERIIVGITSDRCGVSVHEIELHHSFTNDLGID